MPERLKEWLERVANDPLYSNLIWWTNKEQDELAIHWKHASYEDYKEGDSALFKKWAQDNSKYCVCMV